MTKKNKQEEKSEKKLLEEISEKLDKILGVLAIQNVSDVDSKIKILKNLGFSSAEIGLLMGLKNVRVHKGWKGK
ncbi:MAG: Poly (ADP-ribose) polymerase-1 [Nitrosopumilales archaeon]|nr:MAG: Poly (ADP-ribose) polymerase-1 [Nitrosopumilales archaeon]